MKKPYEGKSEPLVDNYTPEITINDETQVQSLLDAHVIYTGQVSGKSYEWPKAGAIINVDNLDVPELLSKRRGRKPCCGEPERPIFQIVK